YIYSLVKLNCIRGVETSLCGPTPTNTIFYDLFFLDRMPYSMAGYKHWLLTESMYCNVYIFNYL
ncbi:hypothetical protein DOD87_24560, partial [Shigella sonnei]|nr:hypothetical protein [Shigella sonnei]